MKHRALLIVVLVVSALVPIHFSRAQTPEPSALVDLAAAVLTPADAEAAGMPGFGRFGNGHQRQLEEYAQQRAQFQGISLDEAVVALTDAGWLQGYSAELGLPDQPGAQNAQPTAVLFSSIYQYVTAEGASAALAYITNYAGVTEATVDTSIDGPTIGDESIWVHTTSSTLDAQGPSDEVAVVFRIGDLVGAIGSIDYTVTATETATPTAVDPAWVDQVAALASLVEEHLNDIGDAPGLSKLVTRIGSDAAMPTLTDEGYRRLDGTDIPYFNGYTDGFPGFATAATDAYEYTAALGQGDDPFEPYYALRVYQFPDDAAASDFLAQTLTNSGDGGSPVPEGAAIGDESIMVPESFEPEPGFTVRGYLAFVRVGDRVSLILFESGDHRPDPAVVIGLAEQQASCLSTGVCPMQPIPTGW